MEEQEEGETGTEQVTWGASDPTPEAGKSQEMLLGHGVWVGTAGLLGAPLVWQFSGGGVSCCSEGDNQPTRCQGSPLWAGGCRGAREGGSPGMASPWLPSWAPGRKFPGDLARCLPELEAGSLLTEQGSRVGLCKQRAHSPRLEGSRVTPGSAP